MLYFFMQFILHKDTKSSILLMEIGPNLAQVDFQIAISSFHDQLLSKLQYFNTVEIELLRKFQCNINLPQTHTELVFYLRNMIKLIEQAFKDVHSYFQDLKMNYLYDYFRKVQILMINGFNFLSQALLIQIDQNDKERESKVKSKQIDHIIVKQRNGKQVPKNLKEQAKQMEHYDFAINYYENEQAKITEELHRIQDNIMMSKGLIDKLHPSKAVKQLQEIKERAEITLENTEKIFEQTYQLKYLQFKQYLSKLQRPEDVTKDFCDNLRVTMRDKFQVGMKKSVNLLYTIKKEDEMAKHVAASVQTDQMEMPAAKLEKKATKNGQKIQNLLIRQRKLTQKLLLEIQNAKREIQILLNDKFRLQIMCTQLQGKTKQLTYNYEILSKIYDQKREETSFLKKSNEEKDTLIDRLRIYELMRIKDTNIQAEEAVQTEQLRSFSDAEVQANMQDNEIIVILKKTNEKMGEKIREKEIRINEIVKKQVAEKKEKMSRLRISQTITPDITASLTKKISDGEGRSPVSSQKSVSSIKTLRQERERASILYPNDTVSKDYSKMLVKPSNFAIKRYSGKQMILEKDKRDKERRSSMLKVAQVAVQTLPPKKESHIYLAKEIQTDFTYQQVKPQRRTEGVRFQQQRSLPDSNYNLISALSQRKHDKRFIKKHLTLSKQKKMKKQITAESNRQDFSIGNRFQQFADSEEALDGERERVGLFQNLNLQSQECKLALQKRSALSKQFLCNVRKKVKNDELDEKNKTCIGQFYRSRKTEDNLETKHLICIDKIDLTKKESKKYEKMSLNSKPSQKFIKIIDKQNTDKNVKIK